MEISASNGTILNFMSLENIGASDMPSCRLCSQYSSYTAIYHDVEDSDDGLSYYYVAFTTEMMDVHVIKVNKADATIKFNYMISDSNQMKAFQPVQFHQDQSDGSILYLESFRYEQNAGIPSVLKLSKRSMHIQWQTEIKPEFMSFITSMVQIPGDDKLYGCGVSNKQTHTGKAVIFSMETDGEIIDYTPLTTSKALHEETCYSIAYDKEQQELVFLIKMASRALTVS